MRKQFILLILLAFQLSVLAQTISPAATPEAAGFSSERLKRIDREMNDWVEKGWMNGAVGLIIHNGKNVEYHGAGLNGLDQQSPHTK